MKVFILPHGPSNGCRELARALGVRRIKRENSSFTPDFNKLVINWGNSSEGRLPRFMAAHANWLNPPSSVSNATDKARCWHALRQANVPTVDYTDDIGSACHWLADGDDVVVRTTLRGSGGDGIHVIPAARFKDKSLRDIFDTLVQEQFMRDSNRIMYTKYFKAADEYRIHVVRGQVIDAQQKRKRSDVPREQVNYQVRSHANGFVFCREDCNPPDDVLRASVEAVAALGLDFGAVDIRWNTAKKQPCVLEVNTAPGLEGSTIDNYSRAFAELFNALDV